MSETRHGWRQSGLAWWPLALATLALDQLTKEIIQRVLALHEAIYVLPVLDILHARNTGAAFSFLAGAGGWQRWMFTLFALAVTVGILITLRRTAGRGQRLLCAGLALIASGAVGNAIDRVRHGFVVDFVAVHWNGAYFPAFNVADACITVGAGLILLDALFDWQRERRIAQEAGPK
jgi:signal peptidase II